MATAKKKDDSIENVLADKLEPEFNQRQTYNPLLTALRENDRHHLFHTNVTTAFHKTGYHLFDYYFGAVINIHDDLGRLIGQEPRVGQAAGTFNLLIGNSGSGKSLPNHWCLPTTKGMKTMGEIQVGDEVYGFNGTPVKVLGVFPQGKLDVYEIQLANGRTVECSEDHLWSGYLVPKFKNGAPEEDYSIACEPFVTLSTAEIGVQDEYYDFYIPCLIKGIDEVLEGCNNALLYDKDSDLDVEWSKVERIISVYRKEECTCIYVDDPDHMFLLDNGVFTHNTTVASQIAANIIRQYRYANVIHFDCENRFDVSRCETITQLPASYFDKEHGERYMIRTGHCGLDIIQEMIVKTYVTKMKLKHDLTVDTGFKDEFGNEVKILEPTVIIIDSITTVLNETFNPESSKEAADAEKMRSNTEGARDAKSLKGFFKDIIPLCKEANIIIYGINHINQNMSMNAFLPVAKQQNFLKQDESIPGGKTMIYYPFNIIKLTAQPSDDFTEEGDGFNGYMVMFEPIKSSSNQSGNKSKGLSFEMVFDQKYGFDPLRTMIMYGRQYGYIEGTRARLKFKDDDSFTFSMKSLYHDKDTKPIWESINKYIVPNLKRHLSFIEPSGHSFDNRGLDY